MTYKCDILLGRITKVKGFEGAVTVRLEKIFTENIPIIESVFLEVEGRPVPFFVSESEYRGADQLKLEFVDYNSIDKIKEFVGCKVFLTTAAIQDTEEEDFMSLINYNVVTNGDKVLGSINEVIENPGQWLLSVITPDNKSILIPFHDHFIVNINKRRKIIIMDLPEGLYEIN